MQWFVFLWFAKEREKKTEKNEIFHSAHRQESAQIAVMDCAIRGSTEMEIAFAKQAGQTPIPLLLVLNARMATPQFQIPVKVIVFFFFFFETQHKTTTTTNQLQECDSSCATCNGTSPNNCLTCPNTLTFNPLVIFLSNLARKTSSKRV